MSKQTFRTIAGLSLAMIAIVGTIGCSQTKPLEGSMPRNSASDPVIKPAPSTESESNMADMQVATLGGGCFWCLEAVFEQLKGVESVVSGYSGGSIADPTYEQVCTGLTDHAEVIQVTFDPKQLSFEDLLEVFFSIHDPTTLNRQGADAGTQYRSVVFYHSEEQKAQTEKTIAKLAADYPDPIVTEITALEKFYPAEKYHQGYFRANGRQPYCQMVVSPKVAKFRKKFEDKLKTP